MEPRRPVHTADHTIRHLDDVARDGGWHLVRRSLGLRSFGLNVVDVPPGGTLPAHDEQESGHEEVYVVLAGTPTITVDGVEHVALPGTFVRFDPVPVRGVRNPGPEPARLLMASAPVDSGFEPLEWA